MGCGAVPALNGRSGLVVVTSCPKLREVGRIPSQIGELALSTRVRASGPGLASVRIPGFWGQLPAA
jgi:hypothetical protein